MATYPNKPNYPGERTPGVVMEFVVGDPTVGTAYAGNPVSTANPFPVTIISGGSGGTGAVNITQVGGSNITIGQDPSSVGAASMPVVLPAGYSLGITGSVTATLGALVAGSAIIGKVGIDQTAGQNLVQIIPGTTGGLSFVSTLHGNNVTAIVVKSGAGQLYAIAATNNSSVYGYLKIYNATSATAGSGTPVDRILIPAPAAGGGGGIMWSLPNGAAYSTGITYCLTGLVADNDTTAPAASSFTVTFYYK